MISLTETLQGSWLLRPWVVLAGIRSATLERWIQNSAFVAFLKRLPILFAPLINAMALPASFSQNKLPLLLQLFDLLGILMRQLLPWGVGLLFILQSFCTTGKIGMGVALLLFLVLVLGLFTRAWERLRGHFTVVDVLLATFLASSAISTAFSSFFHTSIIGFAKMLVFMSGYVVFRVVSHAGRKPLIALFWFLAALGLGESLIGMYQHAVHIQPLATWSDPTINPELRMDRIFGTLQPSNPNLLAGFLIPCMAASLGLILVYLRRKVWLFSIVLLGALLLSLYALVLTGSRGGFLAIAVMLTCLFASLGHLIWREEALRSIRWMKPAWLIILVMIVLSMGAGVVTSEKIRARVASIFAMREDSSISYRLNVYNSAIQMAKDNPIVGIGPGNGTFKLVYGLYMVPGYNALGAYSVPLEMAVEQGFIGLAIFLSLLLVLILRTALALDHRIISLERKLLLSSLLTGILGSFAYGIFDTIWYRPSVNLLFWFMVAALAVLSEPPPARVEANIFHNVL
jgi:putative inorganic carbon (hco3(-)) transporter